jgi:hypothetical protein
LLEIRKRGLQNRKEAAHKKKIDFRLLPLDKYEECYATALCMGLSDTTRYLSMIKSFLDTRLFSESPLLDKDWRVKKLQKKLLQLPKKEDLGPRIIEDPALLENLTRSLLYEVMVEDSGLEMDILIVLPSSRFIVGNYRYLKGPSHQIRSD